MEVREAAEKYNYNDYASWDDGKRYELIDGTIYLMSPAPSEKHQEVSGELYRQLANFLKGKPCKVFSAPFDVCLRGKGDYEDTIVQPDILVVCDKSKLDGKRCNGAPDMIIEVLSPSSVIHDTHIKLNKYLEAGVREYWIADPENKTITVHVLRNNEYVVNIFGIEDDKRNKTISVYVLDGCVMDIKEVFET